VDEKTRNAKTVVSVGLSFIQEERRSIIHPKNGGKDPEQERSTRGLGFRV
jgi:hypothetical protein